ncbi:hypothetical protein TorRG33x02_145730, partial [Trema orientale]
DPGIEIRAEDVEEKGKSKLWADDADGKDEDLISSEHLNVSHEANEHNQATNNAPFDQLENDVDLEAPMDLSEK